ncbi:MAG: hypothetical protein JWM53_1836 [bacterium]|nr:hypothetical protein [bacterium]
MRICLFASLLAAAAGCGPDSHDVELTVLSSAMVSDAALASVRTLEIGAGTGSRGATMSYPLSRSMVRSERLVIHVTSDKGALAIGVIAREAGGAIVALGNASAPLDGTGPPKLTISIQPPATGDGELVHLTPPAYTLFTGQAMTLTSDSDVRWSVQEGDAGGTVDAAGRYTAPASAGSYHVVATSNAYFGHSGSAAIDVLDSGVAPYIGTLGGGGYRDGARGVGRLSRAHGATTDGKTIYFTGQDKLLRAADVATGALSTIAGVLDQPAPVDGTGRAAHFADPYSVVADGLGNLYVADAGSAAVRKVAIASGVVSTFAGTLGMPGYVDGPPGTQRLGGVVGLVSDGAGTLYVADQSNCSVRKIDVATQTVTTIAGSPPGSPVNCTSVDGTGAAARFAEPNALVWDGAGHLYVQELDGGVGAVRRLDVGSGAVTTVAKGHLGSIAWDGQAVWLLQGTLTRIDPSGAVSVVKDPNDRNGGPFYLSNAFTLTIAPGGAFYVLTDDVIVRFDTTTTEQTLIAGARSTIGTPSVVGDRAQTALFGLNSFTLGQDGLLYGKGYDTFFKADPATGEVTKLSVDQSASACCAGMVTDGAGNLYGTGYDHTVRKISLADGKSSVVAGSSATGYKDGIGSAALFNQPADIVLDGAGNAYVADSQNFVIRKIVLATGEVSLFAGTPDSFGYVDATGPAAKFGNAYGLVYDGAGAIYVGDSGNNRIRKITVPGAVVSTVAGSGMVAANDGSAATATFYSPQGLTFDSGKQNLFVADTLNNLVRKISMSTGMVSTIAGTVGVAYDEPGALPGVVNAPNQVRVLSTGEVLLQTGREASILQIRLP